MVVVERREVLKTYSLDMKVNVIWGPFKASSSTDTHWRDLCVVGLSSLNGPSDIDRYDPQRSRRNTGRPWSILWKCCKRDVRTSLLIPTKGHSDILGQRDVEHLFTLNSSTLGHIHIYYVWRHTCCSVEPYWVSKESQPTVTWTRGVPVIRRSS